MKKRIFSFLIAFCLLVPAVFAITACNENPPPPTIDVWDGTTIAEVSEPVENVITIESSAELAGVARAVNNGETTYEGITIKLANNLDLNNNQWSPIGFGSSEANGTLNNGHRFMGSFDGQGYTINNLKATAFVGGASNSEATTGIGLFGAAYNANIKNLNINNATITGNHFVATVVGHARGTTIENVNVEGATISCNYLDADESGDKAGVVVGFIGISPENGSLVKNCSAKNSSVNAARDAGQIIGCISVLDITSIETENRAVQQDNMAYNVVVTDNNETQNTDTNDNIKNDIYGRLVDYSN